MVAIQGVDVASSQEDVNWSELGPAGHREKIQQKQYFGVRHAETGFSITCNHTFIKKGGVSLRHHHVFEQIRYIYEGHIYYGNGKYPPGTLIYVPESVYYGPQTRDEDIRLLTFQFPGPSKFSRKFAHEEFERGMTEMKEKGIVFKDGAAHFPNGKKQDPAEAIYEYLLGDSLEYAPPRYQEPIYIKTDNFPWKKTGLPGVELKHLAYFNECGPNVSILRLAPGASTPGGSVGCIEIRLVLEGAVEYAGKSCPAVSRLYYPPKVQFDEMTSRSGGDVLVFQIAVPGGEAPPLQVGGLQEAGVSSNGR